MASIWSPLWLTSSLMISDLSIISGLIFSKASEKLLRTRFSSQSSPASVTSLPFTVR